MCFTILSIASEPLDFAGRDGYFFLLELFYSDAYIITRACT